VWATRLSLGALDRNRALLAIMKCMAINPLIDRISGLTIVTKDTVWSYEYRYRYTLDSDLGVSKVAGNGAMREFLIGIPAIASLRKMSETEIPVKDGMTARGEKPGKSRN